MMSPDPVNMLSKSRGATRALPARVLLVVAHKLFREALTIIINQAGGFQVFADAGKGSEAIEICRREAPDLVIIAVELEGMGGIETTREILRLRPAIKVILLLSSTEESNMLRAIRSGAVGVVCTSSPTTKLVEALRTVQQGRSYLGPAAWNFVIHRVRQTRPQKEDGFDHLSPQNRQLLGFIIQGKTTRQIADALGVPEGTLRSRRKELMRKMGVRNTVELITSALGRGFEQ
jgi:DNA-binding NarL/FixJ family response regulator